MRELTVKANMDSFNEAMAFVESTFEELECPMKTTMQFSLCADELFSNVAFYAYQGMEPTGDPLFGFLTIRVGVEEIDGHHKGILVLEDAGRQYDPTAKPDPDVTLSAEERKIGGLGIFISKKSMDGFVYHYVNGRNVMTMTKDF